ncbi:MAG: TonB-dependent receptor, partial [Acidobacteria bacterium]
MIEKFLALGTVLLLFVLRLPSADAQVKSTGAVLGTAKDASGGVIAGARVTLKNADTGVSMATETNATGDYSFPVVPVGQYELTVSASGFKTTVLSAISVSALENVRLNVTLSVGPVSQQVTVTAAPAAVNTVTADEGNTVAGAQVRNLPLASRLFTQLVFLEPGVVGSNPTSPTGG